jgi:hypothetical protein
VEFSVAGTDGRTPEAGWECLIFCPRGKGLAIPKERVGDSFIDSRMRRLRSRNINPTITLVLVSLPPSTNSEMSGSNSRSFRRSDSPVFSNTGSFQKSNDLFWIRTQVYF